MPCLKSGIPTLHIQNRRPISVSGNLSRSRRQLKVLQSSQCITILHNSRPSWRLAMSKMRRCHLMRRRSLSRQLRSKTISRGTIRAACLNESCWLNQAHSRSACHLARVRNWSKASSCRSYCKTAWPYRAIQVRTPSCLKVQQRTEPSSLYRISSPRFQTPTTRQKVWPRTSLKSANRVTLSIASSASWWSLVAATRATVGSISTLILLCSRHTLTLTVISRKYIARIWQVGSRLFRRLTWKVRSASLHKQTGKDQEVTTAHVTLRVL